MNVPLMNLDPALPLSEGTRALYRAVLGAVMEDLQLAMLLLAAPLKSPIHAPHKVE